MIDRHIEAAERVIDAGNVVMEIRISAVNRNRPANKIQRLFGVTRLVSNQAEKVESICVMGIRREDPPVKAFRLRKATSPVMSRGLSQNWEDCSRSPRREPE
jgi:hypothetical protein